MIDYSKLRVDELRALLAENGLQTTGRKMDLISRLVKAELESATAPSASIEDPSLIHSRQADIPIASAPNHNSTITKVTVQSTNVTPSEELLSTTETERLILRRERFGVTNKPIESTNNEETKCVLRAQRFGLTTPATEESKRLARTARFGGVANAKSDDQFLAVFDNDELEKRKRRADRFQILTPEDNERRKQARAIRFGLQTANASEEEGLNSWTARLAARKLRFSK